MTNSTLFLAASAAVLLLGAAYAPASAAERDVTAFAGIVLAADDSADDAGAANGTDEDAAPESDGQDPATSNESDDEDDVMPPSEDEDMPPEEDENPE